MDKDTGNKARNAMFAHADFLRDTAGYDPKHIREALIEIAIGVAINYYKPCGVTRP